MLLGSGSAVLLILGDTELMSPRMQSLSILRQQVIQFCILCLMSTLAQPSLVLGFNLLCPLLEPYLFQWMLLKENKEKCESPVKPHKPSQVYDSGVPGFPSKKVSHKIEKLSPQCRCRPDYAATEKLKLRPKGSKLKLTYTLFRADHLLPIKHTMPSSPRVKWVEM